MTPIGIKDANASFLADERYFRYTNSNRVMLLDRQTRQSREIFRPGADELSGISITADEKWLFYSRSRGAAEVWPAEMDPPL